VKAGVKSSEFWLLVVAMAMLFAADWFKIELGDATLTVIVGAASGWAGGRMGAKMGASNEP
jgi:hypothetical protein